MDVAGEAGLVDAEVDGAGEAGLINDCAAAPLTGGNGPLVAFGVGGRGDSDRAASTSSGSAGTGLVATKGGRCPRSVASLGDTARGDDGTVGVLRPEVSRADALPTRGLGGGEKSKADDASRAGALVR